MRAWYFLLTLSRRSGSPTSAVFALVGVIFSRRHKTVPPLKCLRHSCAAATRLSYFFHSTAGLRPRLKQMSPLRGLVDAKFDRLLHRLEPITAATQTPEGARPLLGSPTPPFRFASSTPANATPAFAGGPAHGGLTSVSPWPHASRKTGARRKRGCGLGCKTARECSDRVELKLASCRDGEHCRVIVTDSRVSNPARPGAPALRRREKHFS
jgi:hypothetical protein